MRSLFSSLAGSVAVSTATCLVLITPAFAGGTFVQQYVLPVVSKTAPNGAWPLWELSKGPTAGAMYGVTPDWGSLQGGTLYSVLSNGSFTKLRDFGARGDVNGNKPNGPLLFVTNAFYGVTQFGGTNDQGVLYKWNSGSGYQVVSNFGGGTAGSNPSGPLLNANDGNVYGTTTAGGACNQGTVFKLAPATNAVSVLYSFCGSDGSAPMTGVIQATDGNLYGTAYTGGAYSGGTLFRVTLGGVFTQLAAFGSTATQPKFPSRLIQGQDGLLYGTSYAGGDSTFGNGSLFSSTLAGAVTVRAAFINAGMSNPSPYAALNERFTGVFYGVAAGSSAGNVFQFRASNNSITNIYTFVYGQASYPQAGLTLGDDGNLWGNTTDGQNLYIQRAGTIYNIQGLTANP